MPIVKIEDASFLVGSSLQGAQQAIKDHGYECRIVWSEGRTLVPEANLSPKFDYDPLRVNLHVQDGKVTKAVIQ